MTGPEILKILAEIYARQKGYEIEVEVTDGKKHSA